MKKIKPAVKPEKAVKQTAKLGSAIKDWIGNAKAKSLKVKVKFK